MAKVSARFGRLDILVRMLPEVLEVVSGDEIPNLVIRHFVKDAVGLLKEQPRVVIHLLRECIGALHDLPCGLGVSKIAEIIEQTFVLEDGRVHSYAKPFFERLG